MSKKPKLLTMKKQLFGILLVFLCLILTVVILSSGSDSIDWPHFYQFLRNMKKPLFIIPAFLCVCVSVACESAGLCLILHKLKSPVSFSSSIVYASSDIYFSAITPSATGGQPASAYYMVKNKISLSNATVALLLNITLYIFSLLLLGGIAFALQPELILCANVKVRFLFFTAIALNLALFFACILFMVFPKPSRVIGHVTIRILSRFHIIKDREKAKNAFDIYLSEYRAAFKTAVRYPFALLTVLLTNILQRISIFLVPFFVFLAIEGNAPLWDTLISQALVALSANSIPIPGAVGVSEYLFFSLTAPLLPRHLKKFATLLTRLISHYFCFLMCGVYTFGYHCSHVVKRNKKKEEHHGK